jgi:uncharacterized protein CbrC (UPF0167 family)
VTGEPLPRFRYHPDPVATQNVLAEPITCDVCGEERDYSYVGPYLSPGYHFENGDPMCPWCIADGSAAEKWQASFVPPVLLSDAARAQMPPAALAELELRTPSYLSLQPGVWLDHHGEADAYLGEIGADEYAALPPEAQGAVRRAGGDDPQRPARDSDQVWRLRADGNGPAVYLFQCLHCGRYDGFYAGGGG